MQRSFIVASLFVSSLVAQSAAAGEFGRRGKLYLEGAAGFTSFSGETTFEFDGEEESVDLPDQTQLLLGGTLGAFVVDGFFLGGTLSIDHRSATTEDEDGDEESQSTTTLGLAAAPRYYVALAEARNVFLRVGGHVGYYDISSEVDDFEGTSDQSVSGFGLGAEVGLVIAFGDAAGAVIDFSLFANKRWLSGDDESFGFDVERSLDMTNIGLLVGLGAFF